MRSLRPFALALALGALPAAAPAAIANLAVNYQGQLTDGAGDPVNGTVNLSFQLFDTPTGGSGFWSHVESGVPATQGLFNVELPVVVTPGSRLNGELWLEVSVNGQVMVPRKRLLASLTSYNAEKLQGMDVGSGPNQIPVLDATGKLDPAVVSSPFPLALSGSASPALQALQAFNFDAGANQLGARVMGASALSATAIAAGGYGLWGMTAAGDSAAALGVYGKAVNGVGVRAEAAGAATAALLALNTPGLGAFASGQWGLLVGGSALGLRIGGAGLAGQTPSTPAVGLEVNSTQQGVVVNNTGASPGVLSVNSGASAAVHGRNTSASGVGVFGEHTGLGIGQGLRGSTLSDQGVGVRGEALNGVATGASLGVYGTAASATGVGVSGQAPNLGLRGEATALSGLAYGVRGLASSPQGVGVRGESTGVGVWGEASGPGTGVQGSAARVGGDFSSTDDSPIAYGVRASAKRSPLLATALNATGVDAIGVQGVTASQDGTGVKGVVNSLGGGPARGVYGEALGPQAIGVSGYGGQTGVYGSAPGTGAGQTGVYGYVGGGGNGRYGMQARAAGAASELVYGLYAEVLGAANTGYSIFASNTSPGGYGIRAHNSDAKGGDPGYALGVYGRIKVSSNNAGEVNGGPGSSWLVSCTYCGIDDVIIITPLTDITQGGTVANSVFVSPITVPQQFTVNTAKPLPSFRFYYLVVSR